MSRSKSKPIVSIIIPSFNTKDYLDACLASIFKNTKTDFEVIVVDGGSTDGTKDLINKNFKDKAELLFINLKTNTGPADKRNRGVKKANGKYLAFLDSDTIVDKNWLTKIINYLEKNPKVGGGQIKLLKSGNKNLFDTAGEEITGFGFLSERARSSKDVKQFDRVEPIFSGKTAAMIFRKKAVVDAGMFDPTYFIFWEEPDLCWRIWKLGYEIVFLPQGRVWHEFDRKEVKRAWSLQLTYYGCRNQLMTIIKNGIGLLRIKFLAAATLSWTLILFSYLLKLDFGRAEKVISAFLWIGKNIKTIINKRQALKNRLEERFYSDYEWVNQVTIKRGLSWYLGKGLAYVLQKPF